MLAFQVQQETSVLYATCIAYQMTNTVSDSLVNTVEQLAV